MKWCSLTWWQDRPEFVFLKWEWHVPHKPSYKREDTDVCSHMAPVVWVEWWGQGAMLRRAGGVSRSELAWSVSVLGRGLCAEICFSLHHWRSKGSLCLWYDCGRFPTSHCLRKQGLRYGRSLWAHGNIALGGVREKGAMLNNNRFPMWGEVASLGE